MKPLLVLVILYLAAVSANAQNDTEPVDFIRAVIQEKNICYTDSLSHSTIDDMKSYFDGQFKRNYFKALKITQAEKRYIDEQIASLKKFGWKPGLLENAKFIASDTLDRIIHPRDTSGKPRLSMGYDSFSGFSKPIFLRNHTICFFYQENHCGWLCGGGDFDIYVKRKGVWKHLYNIYNWIS